MTNLSYLSKSLGLCLLALAMAAFGILLPSTEAWNSYIPALLVVVLSGSVYYSFRAKRIIDSITRMASACASGDLEQRVVQLSLKGDLAKMANAVNALVDSADAFVREARATMESAMEQHYYRKVILTGMQGTYRQGAEVFNRGMIAIRRNLINSIEQAAIKLEKTVKAAANDVLSSTVQLTDTSQTLAGIAGDGKQQAVVLADASKDASSSVSNVAAAVEEMSASINEIAQRMGDSARIAGEAVSKSESASKQMQDLVASAVKIEKVLALIDQIANQINLLALNATIESARAGEAGKGFAVVAGEIKTLANNTSNATAEIVSLIEATQSQVSNVDDHIRQISKIISNINNVSVSVAAAVEEQDVATKEISSSIQRASKNVEDVSNTVQKVSSASTSTGNAAGEMKISACGLSSQAKQLISEIDGFIADVRAMAD